LARVRDAAACGVHARWHVHETVDRQAVGRAPGEGDLAGHRGLGERGGGFLAIANKTAPKIDSETDTVAA